MLQATYGKCRLKTFKKTETMKSLLFSLFMLISFLGFNQITNHFENLNSKWYVSSNFINANQENPSHLGVKTTVWGFVGDTLIDNNDWLKLFSTQDSLFQNDLSFQGFLRSEDLKVYFKETDTSSSQILYDFNLEVGDSVEYTFDIDGDNYTVLIKVDAIDTIEINGESYRKFKFSEPLNIENFPITMGSMVKEAWIEGIGSLKNPIFPAKPFTIDTEWGQKVDLTCSFVNEIQFYHNGGYTQCFNRDVLGIEELQSINVNIYPNPTHKIININVNQLGYYNLTIFNNLGEIIIEKRLSGSTNNVNVSELNKGIYFLNIKTDESSQTIKFIKQ